MINLGYGAKEISRIVRGDLITGSNNNVGKRAITSSKEVIPGDIFFALRGERFDGHDFLEGAAIRGASVMVVSSIDNMPFSYRGAIVLAPDTLAAYQRLAIDHRKKVNPIVIAISGSVGKTTVKDMLRAALGKRFSVVSTEKNFNNLIGVPKTILGMDKRADVLILELGTDRPGEMRRLAEIANPDIAILTNIGMSHRENFSSEKEIFKEKMDIVSRFGKGNVLILGDDAELSKVSVDNDFLVLKVKEGEGHYCYSNVHREEAFGGISFDYIGEKNKDRFLMNVPGKFNAKNAALAITAGLKIGASIRDMQIGLRRVERTEHRMQIVTIKNEVTIIDDSYNAAPDSMKAAISFLEETDAKRRIAVLGGMNELGEESERKHIEIGNFLKGKADLLLTLGPQGKTIADASGIKKKQNLNFDSVEKISEWLKKNVGQGDCILLKASNSFNFGKIAEALCKQE